MSGMREGGKLSRQKWVFNQRACRVVDPRCPIGFSGGGARRDI